MFTYYIISYSDTSYHITPISSSIYTANYLAEKIFSEFRSTARVEIKNVRTGKIERVLERA